MAAEQEILLAYGENPNALYSINELARRLQKAYPSVHKTVGRLVEQGILRRIPVGRSHLCGVNLDNQHAVMLLALNHIKKHEMLPAEIRSAMRVLDKYRNNFSLHTALYDPHTKTIFAVMDADDAILGTLAQHPVRLVRMNDLREKLASDPAFYASHIILAGYEQAFSLLDDPTIKERYHPLL